MRAQFKLTGPPVVGAVLVVKDEDFGFDDDVLGVAEVEFSTSLIIKNPRIVHPLTLRLLPADSLGNVKNAKEVKVPHDAEFKADTALISLLLFVAICYPTANF